MLDKEYSYYDSHRVELEAKFLGRFIVIVGEEIVGDYASIPEAYKASIEKYEGGTFLIQEVIPHEKSIQRFHSLVYV